MLDFIQVCFYCFVISRFAVVVLLLFRLIVFLVLLFR